MCPENLKATLIGQYGQVVAGICSAVYIFVFMRKISTVLVQCQHTAAQEYNLQHTTIFLKSAFLVPTA